MPRRITLAVASTGAAALAAAVFAAAPHAQSAPTVLVLEEAGRTAIALDDIGPKGMRQNQFSLGDRLVLSRAVMRGDTKGTLTATATVSTPGRRPGPKSHAAVTATFHFPDGDLYVDGVTNFSDDSGSGAVVGGTGVYAGARGTLESTGDGDKITLLAP
jgi:hypothetical protein